jgi:hypothetical protein
MCQYGIIPFCLYRYIQPLSNKSLFIHLLIDSISLMVDSVGISFIQVSRSCCHIEKSKELLIDLFVCLINC